jgi:hypothetical protein
MAHRHVACPCSFCFVDISLRTLTSYMLEGRQHTLTCGTSMLGLDHVSTLCVLSPGAKPGGLDDMLPFDENRSNMCISR